MECQGFQSLELGPVRYPQVLELDSERVRRGVALELVLDRLALEQQQVLERPRVQTMVGGQG